ncbi:protein MLP1, putative [Entamoeba invadens IP1]|uniref:Protein MLP1, putative n=1 Tax=Entamoeba invadens IP1 TaxID=370355 RepID=L7FL53_ENTIV|nr:protein MLP1, putative [Entamoeba invadens IP1]ELP87637.1 protein MLP1, putative [Entamoeba invadens IP1]|eukprot:XP_004254408.1 protein MLP1, putative [Entamoeba invadens IP1]
MANIVLDKYKLVNTQDPERAYTYLNFANQIFEQKRADIQSAGKEADVEKVKEDATALYHTICVKKAVQVLKGGSPKYKTLKDAMAANNWQYYRIYIGMVKNDFTKELVREENVTVVSLIDEIIKDSPDLEEFIKFYTETNHEEVIENLKKEEAFNNEEKKQINLLNQMKNIYSYDGFAKQLETFKTTCEEMSEEYEKRNISHDEDIKNAEIKLRQFAVESVFKTQFACLKSNLTNHLQRAKNKLTGLETSQKNLELSMNKVIIKSLPESSFMGMKDELLQLKPEAQIIFDMYDEMMGGSTPIIQEVKKVEQKVQTPATTQKVVPKVEPPKVKQTVTPKIEPQKTTPQSVPKDEAPKVSEEFDTKRIAKDFVAQLEKSRFVDESKNLEKFKVARNLNMFVSTYFKVERMLLGFTVAEPNFCALELKSEITDIKPAFSEYFEYFENMSIVDEINEIQSYSEAKATEDVLKKSKDQVLMSRDFLTAMEKVKLFNQEILKDNGKMSKFNMTVKTEEIETKLKNLFLDEFVQQITGSYFTNFTNVLKRGDNAEVLKISGDVDEIFNKRRVDGYEENALMLRNEIENYKKETKTTFRNFDEIKTKSKEMLGYCGMPKTEIHDDNYNLGLYKKEFDFSKYVEKQIESSDTIGKIKPNFVYRNTQKKFVEKSKLKDYIKIVQICDKLWNLSGNVVTFNQNLNILKESYESQKEYFETIDRVKEVEFMIKQMDDILEIQIVMKMFDKMKNIKSLATNLETYTRNGQSQYIEKINTDMRNALSQQVILEKTPEDYKETILKYSSCWELLFNTKSDDEIQQLKENIEDTKAIEKIKSTVKNTMQRLKGNFSIDVIKDGIAKLDETTENENELLQKFDLNFESERKTLEQSITGVIIRNCQKTLIDEIRKYFLKLQPKNTKDSYVPSITINYIKELLMQNLTFSESPNENDTKILAAAKAIGDIFCTEISGVPSAIANSYEKIVTQNAQLYLLFEFVELYRSSKRIVINGTLITNNENDTPNTFDEILDSLYSKEMFIYITESESGVLSYIKLNEMKRILENNTDILKEKGVFSQLEQMVATCEEKVKKNISKVLCEWYLVFVGQPIKQAEAAKFAFDSSKFTEKLNEAKENMNGQVNGVDGLYFVDYLDEMKNTNSSVCEIAQLYDDNVKNEGGHTILVKNREKANDNNKLYGAYITNIENSLHSNPVKAREYYLEAQKIYTQNKKLFDEAEYFYESDLVELDKTIEEACFSLIVSKAEYASEWMYTFNDEVAQECESKKVRIGFKNVTETLALIENETYYPFSCNTLRDRLVQTNPKYEEVFNFVETTQPQLDAICERLDSINLKKKIERDRLKKEKREKEEAEEAERQLMAMKVLEKNNEGLYLENLANFLEREFSHESPSFIHPYSKIAVIVKQAYLFTKTFVSVDNKDILRIKSLYENINKITLENNFSFDEIILLLGAESATYYSENRYSDQHDIFNNTIHKTKFEKIIKLLENNKRDTKELKKKFMLARSKDKKPEEIEKENALMDYREINFQSHFKNYFTEDNEDENPEMVTLMKKYFNFCYNGNYTFTDKNIEIVNHLKKDFLEKLETVFGLQEEGYYDEAKNSLKDALIAKINLVEFLDFENITNDDEKLFKTSEFILKMKKILYSLGVAFEFFDLKYSDLPKVLQDEIKLYNSVMMIKACSVVQYVKFMNTLDNVHQVYLNYNNNLVLKLQSVIRTLATQDYDITHDPIVTEYVRQSMTETVVDKNNLVLYESESKYTENMLNMYKPILSDGVSLTSSKNKLFTLNAVSQFLLSNYAFFDEVTEFSRNVNATLLNKENFGFIPNIFNLITSTVAIVNRTPQSDVSFIKSYNYSYKYKSHFTEEIESLEKMEEKMSYNYRVLLINTNYSIVNYLLCKNWSSQYEYNILMINTETDGYSKPNFDFKANDDYVNETHMKWIFDNFGMNSNKRNYEIQLKSCVNAISGIISFAGYQLDRPKVFPSLNYFGAAVPICKYTEHLSTHEVENKINSSVFVETFKDHLNWLLTQKNLYEQNSIMSNAIFDLLKTRVTKCFEEICLPPLNILKTNYEKKRYDQFVGIYADCVTLSGNDESFEVTKTPSGFEVKAKLPGNAIGNHLTFKYIFNKMYDKMNLVFDHGKCVKNENNVFVWTYKDYKAFDHTEELNHQFDQKDINLPKDLIVMISYIGKMEIHYPLIEQKVQDDINNERMMEENDRIREMQRRDTERLLWEHKISANVKAVKRSRGCCCQDGKCCCDFKCKCGAEGKCEYCCCCKEGKCQCKTFATGMTITCECCCEGCKCTCECKCGEKKVCQCQKEASSGCYCGKTC